jgi:CheY-like chemotaxis protein
MGYRKPANRLILVVDDEPILRMNALEMIEDAGFEVLEADNADAALRLLEGFGSQVVALFTDIHMPGTMDGLQLTKIVHERWPHIMPVVTSGRDYLRDQDIPDSGRFLRKPYRQSDLLGAIRQALA